MRIPKPAAAFSRNRRGISIPGALSALLWLAFWSVTPPAPAQAPAARRTILRPGRVLDVRTGELRSNQAIVIENARIAEIASAGEVKAAAGDATVDLPEATLLPGLIDMHTHLTMDLGSLGYSGLGISTAREALHGARNARRTLEAGFTTVRNLGANDYADIALRDVRVVVGTQVTHGGENLLPPAFHLQGGGVAD